MKKLWSDDSLIIQEEIESLIAEKIPLICARRGTKDLKHLTINKISRSDAGKILVVNHPHSPTCNAKSCLFYYQKKKNSLRALECEQVKYLTGFFGFKLPTKIFSLIIRQFQRIATPHHSSVVFFIQGKSRIFNGKIDDISIDGAKFLVNIPSLVAKNTIIENLTLSLFCRSKYIDEIHIHVPQAKVAWLEGDETTTNTLGIKFLLKGKDHDQLSNYMDLRSIEDSNKK